MESAEIKLDANQILIDYLEKQKKRIKRLKDKCNKKKK